MLNNSNKEAKTKKKRVNNTNTHTNKLTQFINLRRAHYHSHPHHTHMTSTKNFCLYKKEPSTLEDRRDGEEAEAVVSVVATDLDTEKESHVRRYVMQKATKNLLYKSGTINVIPRGSVSPSKAPIAQLVGFIALIELAGEHLLDGALHDQPASGGGASGGGGVHDEGGEEVQPITKRIAREYYICFLCEVDNDHSLSLFHAELKNFTDQLVPILQKRATSSEEDLSRAITLHASSWYWTCVEYITRCVNLLDHHLDKVIHAILLGKQVVLAAPQPVFDDLAKLLLVVSIVNLSPQAARGDDEGGEEVLAVSGGVGNVDDGTKLQITCTPALLTTFPPAPADGPGAASNPQPLLRNNSTPYIPRAGDYGDMQVSLNTKETNSFCSSWAGQLRHGSSDPFRLRTLLEELKLKVIQELNFIRKVIDQAKLSNYQLYKSYGVLRANSNCDVLLNLLMKDITNDTTTSEVLEVIYEPAYDVVIDMQEEHDQPAR